MGYRTLNGIRFKPDNFPQVNRIVADLRTSLCAKQIELRDKFVGSTAVTNFDQIALAMARGDKSSESALPDLNTGFNQVRDLHAAIETTLLAGLASDELSAVEVSLRDALGRYAAVLPENKGPLLSVGSPFAEAYRAFLDRARETRTRLYRSPFHDLDCEIWAFVADGVFYGLINAEQTAYHEIIRAHPDIEDFTWFDADEPLEGVSWEDWAARKDVWDRLMPTGIPSATCFIFQMTPWCENIYEINCSDVVRNHLPSYAERVEKMADRALMADYLKAHTADMADNAYQRIMEARAYMKTPEGVARLSETRQWLETKLPPHITPETLLVPEKAVASIKEYQAS